MDPNRTHDANAGEVDSGVGQIVSAERGTAPVPAKARTLVAGDSFGRYAITAPLGRGGMGAVYRARDTVLGRDVALKVLHVDEPAGTPRAVEAAARLLREARAAAAMNDPNAVAIFDVGEHEGTPFLAMELIAGATLRKRIGEGAGSLHERARWLRDVASALAAAHERGLVHRDIKPENVMLRDDGIVKVLDFGIARHASSAVPRPEDGPMLPTLTREGMLIGTPAYMAPEQLRGEPLDGRADQFAWGVVAYEVLTGARPWTARDAVRLASEILLEPPPPLRWEAAPLPPQVEAVVMRALEKDADARFPSMRDAVAALDAFLSGAPTEAAIAVAPTRRLGAWLFGAAAVAMLAYGAVAGWRAEAPRPRSIPDRAPQSATSTNAEATEAYRAGVRAIRDGSFDVARAELARATELDPTFAAAHVRCALIADEVDTTLRTHLQLAQQFRSALDPHDAELLWTFVPLATTPADLAESERRLASAAERFPESAEIMFGLAGAHGARGDQAGALALYEEARRRDPRFVAALAAELLTLMAAGRAAAAREVLDVCLRESPSSTTCVELASVAAATEGRCADAELLARRHISLNPEMAEPYDVLANALYSEGQVEQARAATIQLIARRSEALRRVTELQMRTNFAILAGDFVSAAASAREWERAADPRPDEWGHIASAQARMAIALESGDSAEATRLADEYLKRYVAWAPSESLWSTSIYAFETKYAAGTLDARAFRAARDAWARRATAHGNATANAGFLWLAGYAMPVRTEEDGRDALNALPRFQPLPAEAERAIEYDEALGRAYLRAGRMNDALPPLRVAASACEQVSYPLQAMWATLSLGEALEATGDVKQACAAYERIGRAWGGAKPRSITANNAAQRARRAGCAER